MTNTPLTRYLYHISVVKMLSDYLCLQSFVSILVFLIDSDKENYWVKGFEYLRLFKLSHYPIENSANLESDQSCSMLICYNSIFWIIEIQLFQYREKTGVFENKKAWLAKYFHYYNEKTSKRKKGGFSWRALWLKGQPE